MRINRLTLLAATFAIGLPAAALAHVGDRLKAADTNGDGVVDLNEFQVGHEKRFADLDGNGDGFITPEEAKAAFDKFRADRPKPADGQASDAADNEHEQAPKPDGHRLFERVDTDKDGRISKAEWTDGGHKMFARIDKNADGKISADEMKRPRPGDKDGPVNPGGPDAPTP